MKVLVLPADPHACGHYRLIWAAQHLKAQGHDVDINWPSKDSGFLVHFVGDELTDFELPEGTDVVVLQRVSHLWHLQVIPLMRKKGIAVVIDMDDNLTCIHPKNSAYWNYHKKSNTPFSWKNAEFACQDATYVTVSTTNLLKVYAKHGRGMAIDNYVPERYLSIEPEREGAPAFGWAGTVMSHPSDLQVVGKAADDLMKAGYRFKIVGPDYAVKEQFRLSTMPEVTGTIPMENWAQATSQLSVAMAPLEASLFNQGKSRLKILEANSVGVPYVASPRNEYRRFHKESGGGLLADTPKEWRTCIKRLMDDETLRKELGEQGRAYCATQTIEQHAWRWLEAWTNAYETQRAA